MQRFFVPPSSLSGSGVLLTGPIAHQINRVLRMRVGDRLILLNGMGNEFLAEISRLEKEEVRCEVLEERKGTGEAVCRVGVFLALLNKPDKFEWALQKLTEVGAAQVTPVQTERSVAAAPEKGRRERWERIIREAAEQSGRTSLPALADTLPLGAAFSLEKTLLRAEDRERHLSLIPSLDADAPLRSAFAGSPPTSVSLFIGPEGGFSAREVELARQSGVRPVSLGSRILRAETAAVVATALVMYELGEMDGAKSLGGDGGA